MSSPVDRLRSYVFPFAVAAGLGAGTLSACSLRSDAELRAAHVRSDSVLRVAVASDEQDPKNGYAAGVELAKDELNAAGGILGRKIEVEFTNDFGTATAGKTAAQGLLEKSNLALVVGHSWQVAPVASVMYEYAGLPLLYLGPGPARVSRPGFVMSLRGQPSAEAYGGYLAEYVAAENATRILVAYSNDSYGRALANSFESRAEESRIRIVERLGFEGYVKALERSARALSESKVTVDRILIAAKMPEAKLMAETIRAAGLEAGFLGADGMDTKEVAASEVFEGAVVASVFDASIDEPSVKSFVSKFSAKFGDKPTTAAALGYDALMAYGAAAAKSQSVTPAEVMDAMRANDATVGVTGPHRFNDRGERISARLVFKKVSGGSFIATSQPKP